ncbi:hypothetical protein GCM10010421_09150 [Streptomyces glaucus]|uniref:HTH tetR-type domain-containing protein n=1 Tax=Streptomyces glaucus TaxID=284029 RepID=A0ABN3JA42_9ACTN
MRAPVAAAARAAPGTSREPEATRGRSGRIRGSAARTIGPTGTLTKKTQAQPGPAVMGGRSTARRADALRSTDAIVETAAECLGENPEASLGEIARAGRWPPGSPDRGGHARREKARRCGNWRLHPLGAGLPVR